MPDLLQVNQLDAFYGDFQALFGVSLRIAAGEIAAVIGANGAGKSTLLKSIVGWLPARRDAVVFQEKKIGGEPANKVTAAGIALVPEGRGVFPGLSVIDNLRIAGTTWCRTATRGDLSAAIDQVTALFPVLAERRRQPAWSLSGGQQQMLAIGRALVARPRLMLLDEPSLGLAPNLVEEVFDKLVTINRQGVAILLVEQNAYLALEISQRAYVIDQGVVTLSGLSADLLTDPRVQAAYLGS
jgi:branched-chain amino acid transport system ATP-binding protein